MTELLEYLPKVLNDDISDYYYNSLNNLIEWYDREYVRGQEDLHVKLIKLVLTQILNILREIAFIISTPVMKSLSKYNQYKSLNIVGCYLNYYENEKHYTPSHKHLKTIQIIISLGATRTLLINNKKYNSNNGDVFIFNEQIHGVPVEKNKNNSRISIALFCNYE